MEQKLLNLEYALQRLIEGGALRALGSRNPEKELIKQLISTLEEQFRRRPDGRLTAPHIFTLSVPAEFAADIRSNQALLDRLASALTLEAGEIGINFSGNISITIFPDNELTPGQFKVQAIWPSAQIADTGEIKLKETSSLAPKPPTAFLIIDGSEIFTIEQDVINIGRLLENHLVINDPRVSRSHAQLRAVKGRHILFDLDSAGGTAVNGERISQISLHPGDVIALAGIPLVYGQDMVQNIDETLEYKPPRRSDGISSTTIQIEDLNLDL
ncbi:MAG: FhaA domain-containing protein [Chloroflexota bacterium]